MKQKLLAVLATFVAVTPIVGVNAADIKYNLGSEHNFIVNEEQERAHNDESKSQAERESVGVKVTALGEETEDGYIKALATGAVSMIGGSPSEFPTAPTETTFRELRNYFHMYDDLNASVPGYTKKMPEVEKEATFPDIKLSGATYVKPYNEDEKWVDIMSAAEFLTWMKGTESTPVSGETYALTGAELTTFKNWFYYSFMLAKTYEDVFSSSGVTIKGLLTKDYNKATGKVWVVEVTRTGDEITGATLKEETMSSMTVNDFWITVPILYFNKTYDCRYDPVEKTACYKCGEEYQWLVVGKQAATCEAVSGVTSKAKCVKPPKTGVEDYILEFAIAAGICGLVLVAVKRKSLFSRV